MNYLSVKKLVAIGGLGLILLLVLASSNTIARIILKLERLWSRNQESSVRDWGSLSRYREDNLRLGPPVTGDHRVVFFGDSITELWKSNSGGNFFAGRDYLNRGISEQTTAEMLVRFRQDVIDTQAAIVVVLAGTNDIALGLDGERTTGNLASMCEIASAHDIRVVLAALLPVNDYARNRDGSQIIRTSQRPLAAITAINDWSKQYADHNGHIYLDYYGAMADEKGMLRAELSDDGLHPNARGYAVMAPLAQEAIRKALRGEALLDRSAPYECARLAAYPNDVVFLQ